MSGPQIGTWIVLVAIFLLLLAIAEEVPFGNSLVLYGLIVGGVGILVGLFERVPKGDATE